uniref:Uncharacterized protein n=1 Tax=Myoviridae sp. ctCo31 TaxID=2825053 RepID=A0A8S5UM82_9CAUD|nr:MAG TPA: hypothetical protein [Myoviridae sp. ctCo31]
MTILRIILIRMILMIATIMIIKKNAQMIMKKNLKNKL